VKKIFVVDDNNANLFAAQKALAELYKVFTLPSAGAMFELLEDVMPDLILLDIMMPEVTGFDAMKMLREDDRYKNIPVAFLTGRNDPDTEMDGLVMGAVDFISKPFVESDLIEYVKINLDDDGGSDE